MQNSQQKPVPPQQEQPQDGERLKCPEGFGNVSIGCIKPMYPRGLGSRNRNTACPNNIACQFTGVLWFPQCENGYTGRNSECIKNCPEGWQDAGPICVEPGSPLSSKLSPSQINRSRLPQTLGETNSTFTQVYL